jgi:predicted NAD-dependent protein-ADP-ribosyltransferase YbiA (DUF1768 family)
MSMGDDLIDMWMEEMAMNDREAAVLEQWKKECEEWNKIKDEMLVSNTMLTPFEVTKEQRKRMAARGEKLLCEDAEACKLLGIPFRLHAVGG